MAYKVRCKLVKFMGDVEHFPCRFGYKVGDEFLYDGEKFIGRVCPGLFASNMGPILNVVRYSGLKNFEYQIWFYAGMDAYDPSMKKYDGVGYKNLKGIPKELIEAVRRGPRPSIAEMFSADVPSTPTYPTKRLGVAEFNCGDVRTEAWFVAEPYDLCDKGYELPSYNRSMSVLEKIKAEPGIKAEDILPRFTQWEREEIYPPLSVAFMGILLEEMEVVGYIEIQDGKVYPTDKGEAKSTKKVMRD